MLRKLPFIFLSLSALALHADDDHGRGRLLDLTLGKAIRMALEKNFSIVAQKFDPKISRERERSSEGKFDPAFSLSFSAGEDVVADRYSRNSNSAATHSSAHSITQTGTWSTGVSGVTVWGLGYDTTFSTQSLGGTSNHFAHDWTSEATFSLTQPLLRGAGTDVNLADVHVARNNVTISEWGVRNQVMSVITQVINVYNELQFAIENLAVARRSQELARQLLRDNIKRVEIGVKTPLDVTTAQADVASREDAVITATRAVKDQENFLKQLITADMLFLLRTRVVIAPPPSPALEPNVVAGIKAALDLRPDYRQAKLDIENKHITVKVTKNAELPRLDLVASLGMLGLDDDFGTSAQRIFARDQSNWSIGATFSIPIGNRDSRGRYNAAKLEAAQALVKLQQLEQQIIVLVDNASGAVVTARQRTVANREARRLAKESLSAGEARLVAGTGTTFEVLQLQKQLADAETAELRSIADYNKAVAQYRLQTGTTLQVHGVKIQ
ncbi:MAG: TolC family protein [Chthoniobacteraceae bacterium]